MKESAQNYLETILLLEKSNGVVRSIDVAKTLGVTKPSVSRAMGKLKDAGLIEMDENNKIVFTKKGKKEWVEVDINLVEKLNKRIVHRLPDLTLNETLLNGDFTFILPPVIFM